MKRVLETVRDVEEAFNELQTTEAQIAAESATANQNIAKIRSGIVPAVSSLEEKATKLRSSIHAWAEEHKKDAELFPEGRKTLELISGTIAIRKDPPSLVLMEGWKESEVIDELKDADAAIKKAGIKQPDPKLDKTGIKKLFDAGKITDKILKSLGLRIKEDETIIISTKTVDTYEPA